MGRSSEALVQKAFPDIELKAQILKTPSVEVSVLLPFNKLKRSQNS